MGFRDQDLPRAVARFGLSKDQLDLLAQHWTAIGRWKSRLNLTAVQSDEEAALLHYADSLELVAHLLPGAILDVGSGAGFPGVPLAIATKAPVTLMEPRQKRASFLRTVRAELGLTNVQILETRSSTPPSDTFPNVVTRATFSKPEQLLACLAWVEPNGQLLALRSPPASALASATHPYELGGRQRLIEIWRPARPAS